MYQTRGVRRGGGGFRGLHVTPFQINDIYGTIELHGVEIPQQERPETL